MLDCCYSGAAGAQLTKGNITASDNVNTAVDPVGFVDSGYPDVPTAKLSAWGATATLAADMHPIEYAPDDLVLSDGVAAGGS